LVRGCFDGVGVGIKGGVKRDDLFVILWGTIIVLRTLRRGRGSRGEVAGSGI